MSLVFTEELLTHEVRLQRRQRYAAELIAYDQIPPP